MRISDWSSDVCSSDLSGAGEQLAQHCRVVAAGAAGGGRAGLARRLAARAHVPEAGPARRRAAGARPAHAAAAGARRRRGARARLRLGIGRRPERKSAVSGKSVSVRVDLGGRRSLTQKKTKKNKKKQQK